MQKINYQLMTDAVIRECGGAKRTLLLHACCAPCASYVLEYLLKYFNITVYFYNPNILPEEEYYHRLSELERLCGILPHNGELNLIRGSYEPDKYISAIKGRESDPEGGGRCGICIGMRIDESARFAAKNKFDFFSTTLTVSPHKNAELINGLGFEAEARYGVRWLPSDFKKRNGYLRSTELCREYGIYRQNYCGCGFGNI